MQGKEKQNKKEIWALLVIIIIAQSLLLVKLGSDKESMHIDEYFTLTVDGDGKLYHYSNPEVYDTWTSAEEYERYLSVDEEERFDYKAIYDETLFDMVHPPLYYFIYHTVRSVFPHADSRQLGYLLNVILFVGCQFTLFLLGRLLFRNNIKALLPVLFYGISTAALHTVLLIRMYMMCNLFGVLLVYFLALLYLKGVTIRRLIPFGVVLALGVLTHYYFIFLALFLCGAYTITLLKRKAFRDVGAVLAAIALSALATFAVHTHIFDQLLHSEKSTTAFSTQVNFDLIKGHVIEYFRILTDNILPGTFLIVAIVILCLLFVPAIRNLQKETTDEGRFILLLSLSVALYFLFVAFIAPYIEVRYIIVFPQIYLLLIFAIFYICENIFRENSGKKALAGLLVLFLVFQLGGTYRDVTAIEENSASVRQGRTFHRVGLPIITFGSQGPSWLLFSEVIPKGTSDELYLTSTDEILRMKSADYIFEAADSAGVEMENGVEVMFSQASEETEKEVLELIKQTGGYETITLVDDSGKWSPRFYKLDEDLPGQKLYRIT
jgi:hypothetical protein